MPQFTRPDSLPVFRSRRSELHVDQSAFAEGGVEARTAGGEELWLPRHPESRQRPSVSTLLEGLWVRANTFVTEHSRLSMFLFLTALVAIALWSRYRYVFGDYTYTLGSGDAQLAMLKALLLREGITQPNPELVPTPAIFDQPPLIPLLLAGVSYVTSLPLRVIPFIIIPVMTTGMLLAFFDLVRRTFSLPTALLATVMLALLPRFSFDSTEPDKAAFVVSFAVLALWLLVVSKGRGIGLVAAGGLLALSCFSHVTGYFFLPVFAATYLSVRGFSRESIRDRALWGALALPALAFAVYAFLARWFTPASAADASNEGAGGILPSFLQRYADTLASLAADAFLDSGWGRFFDGIETQLTTPVFYFAIAGLVMALVMMWRSRSGAMLPFVVWAVAVTFCFAIQYPASSHGSRYPSYVTPAFIVLAAFAVVTLIRLIGQRWGLTWPGVALALAVFIVGAAIPLSDYVSEPNPGLRDVYGGYRDVAHFTHEEGLLADGSHILYLGWPSITFELLDSDISYQDQIHSFGFGLRDLEALSPEFVEENNIRYYIESHAGNDGFDSSTTVLAQLQNEYRLVLLGRFERRPGNFGAVYRIEPAKLDPDQEEIWREILDQNVFALSADSELENPHLQWSADGSLVGWIENGVVALEELGGPTGGVLIDNRGSFGGVRQLIHADALQGARVTVIAEVWGDGDEPAGSAVLALGPEGEAPFSQILVPLSTEPGLILLEVSVPEDIEDLRVTIASGVADPGDIAIARLFLLPGTTNDILERYESE